MAKWHIKFGSWWAVQWSWNWWVSLGIHIDLRYRETYGPYVDLHIGPAILSVGRNPSMTDPSERQLSICRGGRFGADN